MPQASGDNMFLLSLMSQQESGQRTQSERASLLDAQRTPEFIEPLPENQAVMGEAHTASLPSDAAYLPSVDVSQL